MAKVFQDTRTRKNGGVRPWCISYVGLDGKRHRDRTSASTKAEAEAILREILVEEPDNPQARREFALVLGFTGRFEESIEELRRVVETDSGFLEARNDLAMTFAMLGMVDEARSEFETVLEMDPTNAMALRQIVYFQ